MLHRRYLTEKSLEFDFSKNIAITTSMEVLRLQAIIHEGFRPGGALCRDRWFLSALSMYDYLISAMMVYLSLIQSLDRRSTDHSYPTLNDQQIQQIELLKQSNNIWSKTEYLSAEMKRASRLIVHLLKSVNCNITSSSKSHNSTEDLQNHAMVVSEGNGAVDSDFDMLCKVSIQLLIVIID